MKTLLLLLLPIFSTAQQLAPYDVYFLLEKESKYAEIAFAIYTLESGHGSSNIAKKNNNLFGMKYPEKRATTATKQLNGYAFYETQRLSIFDYIIYEKSVNAANEWEFWKHICNTYKSDNTHVEDYAQMLINQIIYNRKKYKFITKKSSLVWE